MKLHSKRLLKVAQSIKRYKKGTILADIGTDHAYLPCFLLKQNIIEKAYACDVAALPLESSKKTIKDNHLEDQCIPLLGNGLDPIKDKEVDMISICGMGGLLMTQILDANKQLLNNHIFFLQANTAIDLLREYLFNNNMIILDEFIVKDGHHIYEIIVAIRGDKHYSREDIFFGPILRVKKDDLFIKKWTNQLNIENNILKQLDENNEVYSKHLVMKKQIEAILNESK